MTPRGTGAPAAEPVLTPERKKLGGILVPVTTPFDPHTGDVAPISFRENLRRWMAEPLDGAVLFGSTGEGKLLDEDEKLRLLEMARDLVPEEKALVVGAGAESTRATIRQVKPLAEMGADAALVSAPPYFGSTLGPDALLEHYRAVADASPVPVLVYHIPKFTHVTMEAGLIGELARHPNIAGLKESSGDVKRFAAYSEQVPPGFRLLVGSGALLYTALELGAAGAIVAVGLLAPAECARILHEFRAGNTRNAGRAQTRIAPVHNEVIARYGARGAKAALDLLGMSGGAPRPPLKPLTDKERKGVAQALEGAGLL